MQSVNFGYNKEEGDYDEGDRGIEKHAIASKHCTSLQGYLGSKYDLLNYGVVS